MGQCCFVVPEIICHPSEKRRGCDCARHHDDVKMGGYFYVGGLWSGGRKDVEHEILAARDLLETALGLLAMFLFTVHFASIETYASVCSVAYLACL
jgi:hypothetical protein